MLNKVIQMGRLTKDPELRYTQSSIAVVKFRIAVDRNYKKDGKKVTDFFEVEAWRATAEFVGQYFTKGMQILVEGGLETESWEDSNTGAKRTKVYIAATACYFADSKKTGDENENQANNASDYAADRGFDPYGSDAGADVNNQQNTFDPFAA